MVPRETPRHAAAGILASLAIGWAHGDVLEIVDKDDWIVAVGPSTTVDFSSYPEFTVITDQYADLGVVFADGDDTIYVNEGLFLNDDVGLDGNGDIVVVFDSPQFWIGADHPGYLRIQLLRDGELLYASDDWGPGGTGNFLGLISTQFFDAAILIKGGGEAEIDDLHFGPPVCPADLDVDALVGVTDLLQMLMAWGTDPGAPPDLDGDGNVGITDFLLLLANWGPCPFFLDCNENGVFDLIDLDDGTGHDCNYNAILDECDIVEGTSPDFDGNGVPDECELANDNCEDAQVITEGTTPVVTIGATTDGLFTFNCEGGEAWSFVDDVWFLYMPACTGTATFSLCNEADFDTRLAVYYAGPCPPVTPLACSDNAAGCGQTSEVEQYVAEGFPYLVRVGGTEGWGVGMLTISCEAEP